jgi:hypothetical protein
MNIRIGPSYGAAAMAQPAMPIRHTSTAAVDRARERFEVERDDVRLRARRNGSRESGILVSPDDEHVAAADAGLCESGTPRRPAWRVD